MLTLSVSVLMVPSSKMVTLILSAICSVLVCEVELADDALRGSGSAVQFGLRLLFLAASLRQRLECVHRHHRGGLHRGDASRDKMLACSRAGRLINASRPARTVAACGSVAE